MKPWKHLVENAATGSSRTEITELARENFREMTSESLEASGNSSGSVIPVLPQGRSEGPVRMSREGVWKLGWVGQEEASTPV